MLLHYFSLIHFSDVKSYLFEIYFRTILFDFRMGKQIKAE